MCPRHTLRPLLMKPTGETDRTFDGHRNGWDLREDDPLSSFPSSEIEDLPCTGTDFITEGHQDFPLGHATALAFNPNLYSMDYNSFDPRDTFQSDLCNMNYTRFAGVSDSMFPRMSFDDTYNIPATTQWDLATVLSPPPPSPLPLSTTTHSNQARPFACKACLNAVSFTLKKDLNRHIRTVHATGKESAYHCRCGKIDRRKDNHLRHVGTCNKSYPSHYYTCTCHSTYIDKEEYIDHVQSRLNNC
ncbi:hypothetical protein F5Y12DRAFT_233632 [Xylaria sp. FL1777]|nr:hypothetical protein F5Y12DRAFT_233632 [Xylaria sp. FL1777]